MTQACISGATYYIIECLDWWTRQYAFTTEGNDAIRILQQLFTEKL